MVIVLFIVKFWSSPIAHVPFTSQPICCTVLFIAAVPSGIVMFGKMLLPVRFMTTPLFGSIILLMLEFVHVIHPVAPYPCGVRFAHVGLLFHGATFANTLHTRFSAVMFIGVVVDSVIVTLTLGNIAHIFSISAWHVPLSRSYSQHGPHDPAVVSNVPFKHWNFSLKFKISISGLNVLISICLSVVNVTVPLGFTACFPKLVVCCINVEEDAIRITDIKVVLHLLLPLILIYYSTLKHYQEVD